MGTLHPNIFLNLVDLHASLRFVVIEIHRSRLFLSIRIVIVIIFAILVLVKRDVQLSRYRLLLLGLFKIVGVVAFTKSLTTTYNKDELVDKID